jgi:nickel-type superoxide dismutase maturation protease
MTFLPIRFRAYFPLRRAKVSGDSMLPALRDGQTVLFHSVDGFNFSAGDVVLIERESYPGIFYIKRVKIIDSKGIWVEGDNSSESTDSRTWGYLSPNELIAVAFRRH